MQYWLKNGQIERLENAFVVKHPEKLNDLKAKGFIRVMSESDWSPYKTPKIATAKIAVKKIKKRIKKK
tara:strand:+ start:1175 stop:1378 length:204 start_codon:yes stop_codon:yes gene_type:complete